jgi:hypothetical protein
MVVVGRGVVRYFTNSFWLWKGHWLLTTIITNNNRPWRLLDTTCFFFLSYKHTVVQTIHTSVIAKKSIETQVRVVCVCVCGKASSIPVPTFPRGPKIAVCGPPGLVVVVCPLARAKMDHTIYVATRTKNK